MSTAPRAKSSNLGDLDPRPVLAPSINKTTTINEPKKPGIKPHKKVDKPPEIEPEKGKPKQALISPTFSPPLRNLSAPSILRHKSLSLNASCSSDASSDSSHSRASTGRISRSSVPVGRRRGFKLDKVEKGSGGGVDGVAVEGDGLVVVKKRCAWVSPNAEDPSYAKFHDEEWGVPVHDDCKLFELLCYAVALAELTWPIILGKRDIFREVFLDFNPISVSKLNEKKICAPGSAGNTILSELKLRNIIENARQMCKITAEFGTFDKYIWGFMNHKPIVNKFRYPRQVPVKTSKADMISKDLVRRGFRGVGPTVVYSFMQAAGLTNDHLVTCFRFQECVAAGDGIEKGDLKVKLEDEKSAGIVKLELATTLDEMSICLD